MKRIRCPQGAIITITELHLEDAVLANLRDLAKFKHEGDTRIFNRRNSFYTKGDEEAEFFTEAYLYTLFEDKDAARNLLGRFDALVESLGYTKKEVWG